MKPAPAMRLDYIAGETVVVVRSPMDVPLARRAHPSRVVYLADEIAEIRKRGIDGPTLRNLHAIKKTFGGSIVPEGA